MKKSNLSNMDEIHKFDNIDIIWAGKKYWLVR